MRLQLSLIFGLLVVFWLALLWLAAPPAAAGLDESGAWPSRGPGSVQIEIPSQSPFALHNVGPDAPSAMARVTFTPARGASAQNPAPAVILLHGAGGVSQAREGRYAREFAAQGVAVAVIDVFGARGGGRFMERLIKTTEAMALADAFAVKAWLAARDDVDGARVALIGFSYGGMSTTYAAYAQVARTYGAEPFAAHVAFYGPCIARFDDVTTTGAPILMLWGDRDAIMDPTACEATATDLRAGGSLVEIARYDAMHRWDGGSRRWRAPAHIADCRFRVGRDGAVRDEASFFVMEGPVARAAMLALCINRDGYLIGADDEIRRLSNAQMARFLNPILFPDEGDGA
ncbi:MAG: alpha/beta fold hydrolase [Pseudomonadota bacterium]